MNKAIWKPIETLDKSDYHFVLIYEDGAIRIGMWNPIRACWESPDAPFKPLTSNCAEPTHWMELPEEPRKE